MNSWKSFGDTLGSYLGFELRATANPSQMPPSTLEFAFMHYCKLALECFDICPPRRELAAHFYNSELIAIALDGEILVGVAMGCQCALPGLSRHALYVSGTFTAPSIRRLGVGSRLTAAMTELAYPDLFQGIFGMWGQSIVFVTRTQTFSVYRIFRKWFRGVASVGRRPKAELQSAIDAVANAFGWSLDKDNIQHEAYSQGLSRYLVPTLSECDAIVLAGKYNWTLHMISSMAFVIVYPVVHMLHRSRAAKGRNYSTA